MPWHHFLGKLICQTGGWAGWLTWASPALFQGLWICPPYPPSLPFPLCVSVCACLCVSVWRLQTDQLSAWAQHQAAGRSMSHMWQTKREAVRLGSNDLNMSGKEWVHLFNVSYGTPLPPLHHGDRTILLCFESLGKFRLQSYRQRDSGGL